MPPFEVVYDEYFRFVWASARRLGATDAAIDDIVQDVFLVIHAKLSTVHKPESLRSWIYGIVRRTVSSHRRRLAGGAGSLSSSGEGSDVPCVAPTPQELSERSSQVELLAQLLSTLSEPKREVFILAELEEMSVVEIAEALEIPVNTAYSRLRHARQEFELALRRHELGARRKGLA